MKLCIFVVCLVLGIFAMLGTLVSALSYDFVFITVAVLSLLSVGGFAYLARVVTSYRFLVLAVGLMPLYALLDISLRYFGGVRALDFVWR